jgi:hypothetical protein
VIQDAGTEEPATPLLSVVHGNPTTEELAALVAVLAVLDDGAGAVQPSTAPAQWGRPALRVPLVPGPGAWKASALPSP